MTELFYKTGSPRFITILKELMAAKEFAKFRLVGDTALSLQRGHRASVDIDLCTDEKPGSVNFILLENFLKTKFKYLDGAETKEIGKGKTYFIGKDDDDCVKLAIYCTNKFRRPILEIDGLRLASVEELIATKLDIIIRGPRKKNFWDLHELTEEYSFNEMLSIYKEWYSFSPDKKEIKAALTNFSAAENDFEPLCLRGKHWEVIKLDLLDFVAKK